MQHATQWRSQSDSHVTPTLLPLTPFQGDSHVWKLNKCHVLGAAEGDVQPLSRWKESVSRRESQQNDVTRVSWLMAVIFSFITNQGWRWWGSGGGVKQSRSSLFYSGVLTLCATNNHHQMGTAWAETLRGSGSSCWSVELFAAFPTQKFKKINK